MSILDITHASLKFLLDWSTLRILPYGPGARSRVASHLDLEKGVGVRKFSFFQIHEWIFGSLEWINKTQKPFQIMRR